MANYRPHRRSALIPMVRCCCRPLARAHCHHGRGDFHMSAAGKLRRRKANGVAPFVYTGVQPSPNVCSRARATDGRSSTNLLWDRAIAAGRCFGIAHQACVRHRPPAKHREAEAVLARLGVKPAFAGMSERGP